MNVLKKISVYVCGFGVLLFLILICYVNLFHYNYRMNADIASEALLGQEIWIRKQWVPESWYPSTEVRIIGTANLSAFFYGMSGSLQLAMGLACVCAVLWIAFNVMYLFAEVEGGGVKFRWIFMVLFMLALPANFSLLEVLYLFAGYYAVHAAVLLFYLGVYGGCLRKGRLSRRTSFVSICLAFLLGLQGARGMLVIYGPSVAVEILRQCNLLWTGRKVKRTDWLISIWVLLNFLFNFLGSSLPISVHIGFSRNIRKGFYKLFTVVIPDIAESIGFYDLGLIGRICLGILLLNAFCMLFKIAYKIWKKRELEILEWIYLVICLSPIMTVFMVAFTTVESTGRYYFMILVMVSMGAVLLFNEKTRYMVIVQILCCGAIGYLTVANIANIYMPMLKSEEPPRSDYVAVTDFLEENEYLSAYASFENANTMTVISDGKVKVAPVASLEKMNICKWLSSRNWYPPYISEKQTTAYVVTDSQMPEFSIFLSGKEEQVKKVKQIGKFHIYASSYNYTSQCE